MHPKTSKATHLYSLLKLVKLPLSKIEKKIQLNSTKSKMNKTRKPLKL